MSLLKAFRIGRAELSPEQCFHGLDKCLDLGGASRIRNEEDSSLCIHFLHVNYEI